MRRYIALILVAAALALPTAMFPSGQAPPAAATPDNGRIPEQYIVTLKPGERPRSVVNRFRAQNNINIKHTYEHALQGFSARIPDNLLEKIRNDPAVLSVVEDRIISITSDSTPTGIRRSEADRNAITQIGSHTNPVNADVAVIDSGIDGDHPDLNVVGGISCVPGQTSWEDQHGHGTHVAGTIGALDNGSGVVGVAPGARLWSVRVLNANGEGEISDAICGIDWITANAGVIDVVNMSLGGEGSAGTCTDGGFRQAICESIEAGVAYVVAAGNSSADANTFVPAAFPEVITVSALADTDGKPGGSGPSSFFYGADDTLATFSNYGSAVDIAAPGVNIQSTWINGGYNTLSGTSMASPHVAGAAAIYLSENPGASPAATRAHILGEAWAQSSTQGFTGDTDGFAEPLLNAGTIGGLDPLPPPPPPPSGCSLTEESGTVGSRTTLNCTGFQPYEWAWIYWDSVDQPSRGLIIASSTGEGSFTLTIPDAAYGEHTVIARGSTSGVEANLPFSVEPGVQLPTATGTAGTFVAIYATGFGANESVDLRWYTGPDTFSLLKTATTSSTGRATIVIYIPDGPGGPHTVEAFGTTTGARGASTFTLRPGVKLSPFAGNVGSNFTATVSGFQDGESIELRWAGNVVANGLANELGKASFPIMVPEGPVGSNPVEAVGDAGSQASATFTINPSLSLSSSQGTVGTDLNVTLRGFAANETIRLDWTSSSTGTATLATVQASSLGSAPQVIQIPESTSGYYTIRATGLSSSKSVTAGFILWSSIELSEASGLRGDTIVATLRGYKANETVYLKWYEAPYSSQTIASTTTSALGSAMITFEVPTSTSYGDHKVESVAASGLGRASTTFTVEGVDGPVEATCTVDPETGVPGMLVTIECYGFAQGEFIRIYWDTTTTYAIRSIYAANGSGSTTLNIPDSDSGEHSIIGVGSASGSQALAGFTVEPTISLHTSSGTVGSAVFATFRGFEANETINIYWVDDGVSTMIGTATSSSNGRAAKSIYIPSAANGTHTIRAVGQSSNGDATADFSVVPRVRASLFAGSVGTNMTITISGFGAGSSVDVYWDDTKVGTVSTSGNGEGMIPITVPEAAAGQHNISASDGNGLSASTGFQVNPSMSLSDSNSVAGDEIIATLKGFGANETVEIRWYTTSTSYSVVATMDTSAVGSVSLPFIVPEDVNGFHFVNAYGTESRKIVNGYFTLSASVSLSVAEGPTGTTVTATLTGFKKTEALSLHWFTSAYSSYEIATGTSNASGSATITFEVPADATPGGHKVEGRSLSGFPRASSTFTVS